MVPSRSGSESKTLTLRLPKRRDLVNGRVQARTVMMSSSGSYGNDCLQCRHVRVTHHLNASRPRRDAIRHQDCATTSLRRGADVLLPSADDGSTTGPRGWQARLAIILQQRGRCTSWPCSRWRRLSRGHTCSKSRQVGERQPAVLHMHMPLLHAGRQGGKHLAGVEQAAAPSNAHLRRCCCVKIGVGEHRRHQSRASRHRRHARPVSTPPTSTQSPQDRGAEQLRRGQARHWLHHVENDQGMADCRRPRGTRCRSPGDTPSPSRSCAPEPAAAPGAGSYHPCTACREQAAPSQEKRPCARPTVARALFRSSPRAPRRRSARAILPLCACDRIVDFGLYAVGVDDQERPRLRSDSRRAVPLQPLRCNVCP